MIRTLLCLSFALLAAAPAHAESKADPARIDRALAWLALHQDKSGLWKARDWTASCTKGTCPQEGYAHGDDSYHVGVTGLSLLAFVRAGHTHQQGAHQAVVDKAVKALIKKQAKDGTVGYERSRSETIYNHAIATLALAEVFGASKDEALRPVVRKAVQWCIDARNPGLGWKYGVKTGKNDTSVSGWMVHAIEAGRRAGLKLSPFALMGADNWFKRATHSTTGAVGYETPGGGSAFMRQMEGRYDSKEPVCTAIALSARPLCGARGKDPLLKKGAALVSANPPSWDTKKRNYYYWYNAVQGLAHYPRQRAKFVSTLLKLLNSKQVSDGCGDGSWPAEGPWCLAGGRVYGTAILTLTMLAINAPEAPIQDGDAKSHGGVVFSTRGYFFEVYLSSSSAYVWISDSEGKPVAVDGLQGELHLTINPLVKKPKKSKKPRRRRKAPKIEPPKQLKVMLKAVTPKKGHAYLKGSGKIGSRWSYATLSLTVTGLEGLPSARLSGRADKPGKRGSSCAACAGK